MASQPNSPLPLVARLLPRPFRERVVEPAYADLLLDQDRAHGGTAGRLAARGVFALECCRLGLPAWLWWRGRPTRFSQGMAAILALFALLIWIVATQLSYS